MEKFFDPAGGGHPVWFQHFTWYLGQPSVWLTILSWAVLLFAIIKIIRILWQKRSVIALGMFILTTSIALIYYGWLSVHAYDLYTEGRGAEVILLKYAKQAVVILSLVSLGWILLDWLRSHRKTGE